MKKFICIVLVLACVFSVASTAFAATGTVIGGTLKMRMQPSTSAYVACYLKNGTVITVNDYDDIWYKIKGWGYQHSDLTGWYEEHSGYGKAEFISVW